MRKLLSLTPIVALVLPVALAHAQAPASSSQGGSAAGSGGIAKEAPAHGPAAMTWSGHPGMQGGWNRHAWEKHGWTPRRPVMPRSSAAFFRFRAGPASITIRCAENESTEECVKAAIMLMQAVKQMHPGARDDGSAQ